MHYFNQQRETIYGLMEVWSKRSDGQKVRRETDGVMEDISCSVEGDHWEYFLETLLSDMTYKNYTALCINTLKRVHSLEAISQP